MHSNDYFMKKTKYIITLAHGVQGGWKNEACARLGERHWGLPSTIFAISPFISTINPMLNEAILGVVGFIGCFVIFLQALSHSTCLYIIHQSQPNMLHLFSQAPSDIVECYIILFNQIAIVLFLGSFEVMLLVSINQMSLYYNHRMMKKATTNRITWVSLGIKLMCLMQLVGIYKENLNVFWT